MLCLYPINNDYACGQCMNCRINDQRVWASRIQLEAFYHPYSSFITLTYSDDHVPVTETGLPTLNPDHLERFRRRLWRYTKNIYKLRWFAVGEYGTQTERPHYHAVLFGAGLEVEQFIEKAWSIKGESMGFHQIGELTHTRAAYAAQYTTKKMTKVGHHKLGDRYPEFIRTSREKDIGGIGAPAADWLASLHRMRSGRQQLYQNGDVWKSVRIGGKIWPLGKYMRKRIRARLGIPQTATERAEFFDLYDPETGEILAPDVLPETYCPSTDITDINSPWRDYVQKKERAEGLADLEKQAAHRARKRARRFYQTTRI